MTRAGGAFGIKKGNCMNFGARTTSARLLQLLNHSLHQRDQKSKRRGLKRKVL
jgi:hypothetical protein